MTCTPTHIVLASGSPRRLEILRAHGIEPEVVLPNINEEALLASFASTLSPKISAQRLALCKARNVLERINKSVPAQKNIILAADTLVYHAKEGIFGKPSSPAEARQMLQKLNDTSHTVVTGVALIDRETGAETTFSDITIVRFCNYTQQDIDEYLAAEPPYDKAGSYAIQGMWGAQVSSLKGDYENVMGLPFYRLEDLLTPCSS